MEGKTHRVGGMLCCLGGYALLESKGLLLEGVSPVIQLAVMYPFAIYGSVAPDLDHHWQSAPCKDIVSYVINKVLHLTTNLRKTTGSKSSLIGLFDARHRSWQTHSDLFLFILIVGSIKLLDSGLVGADALIFRLIVTGLSLGVISHLILDMLTPEGVWSVVTTFLGKVTKFKLIPRKISFVPNTKFFSTGGPWEMVIRKVMWLLCFLLVVRIIYTMSPYSINFVFG